MIEYGVLNLKKVKNIEEELNTLARKGWRVKCNAGKAMLVLVRQIEVKQD